MAAMAASAASVKRSPAGERQNEMLQAVAPPNRNEPQPHDHHVRLKLPRATDQNHKPYCFTRKTVRQKLVYDFLKLKFCTRHRVEPALCGSAARLWPPSWYISASLASRRWRGSSWVPSNSPPSS